MNDTLARLIVPVQAYDVREETLADGGHFTTWTPTRNDASYFWLTGGEGGAYLTVGFAADGVYEIPTRGSWDRDADGSYLNELAQLTEAVVLGRLVAYALVTKRQYEGVTVAQLRRGVSVHRAVSPRSSDSYEFVRSYAPWVQ